MAEVQCALKAKLIGRVWKYFWQLKIYVPVGWKGYAKCGKTPRVTCLRKGSTTWLLLSIKNIEKTQTSLISAIDSTSYFCDLWINTFLNFEFQISHVSAKVLHFPKEWTLFASSDGRNDSCISEQDSWRNCYCHHFQCSQSLWFVSLTKISKILNCDKHEKSPHFKKNIIMRYLTVK